VPAATHSSASAPAGCCCRNHRPLHVAEQFRTVAALHPGRIDLGIGRSEGAPDEAIVQAFGRPADDAHGSGYDAQLDQLLSFAGIAPLPETSLYRREFVASAARDRPHAILGLKVMVGEDDAERAASVKVRTESDVIGGPARVVERLAEHVAAAAAADEVIVTTNAPTREDRWSSYDRLATALGLEGRSEFSSHERLTRGHARMPQ
jgi:alkanesulfonate monooxygenase SsuD/methylene tetrahydromethanopterin reductase-like flavin-dependent oxidoreductase (luciferase family)